MTPQELEYYRHLASIMLKTRGARFTAASSLVVRERWSIATTSFLSVFMLSWSVFLVAQPEAFSRQDVRFLGGLAIVASVAVLVLTLLDYAYGRTVRSEKLQQNALKISLLMRRLERELCSATPSADLTRAIAQQYEETVAEIQVNHSSTDFRKWQVEAERPKTLPGKTWRLARLSAFNVWYYMAPVTLHLLVLFVVVGGSMYYVIHHQPVTYNG